MVEALVAHQQNKNNNNKNTETQLQQSNATKMKRVLS